MSNLRWDTIDFLLLTRQCPLGKSTHPVTPAVHVPVPVKTFTIFLNISFLMPSIITLGNTFFIETYPQSKIKTVVRLFLLQTDLVQKNQVTGAWMLTHSQHNNNNYTLLHFLTCRINFFLCAISLFVSFFAFTFLLPSISSQPSQILTVCCTSFFFSKARM